MTADMAATPPKPPHRSSPTDRSPSLPRTSCGSAIRRPPRKTSVGPWYGIFPRSARDCAIWSTLGLLEDCNGRLAVTDYGRENWPAKSPRPLPAGCVSSRTDPGRARLKRDRFRAGRSLRAAGWLHRALEPDWSRANVSRCSRLSPPSSYAGPVPGRARPFTPAPGRTMVRWEAGWPGARTPGGFGGPGGRRECRSVDIAGRFAVWWGAVRANAPCRSHLLHVSRDRRNCASLSLTWSAPALSSRWAWSAARLRPRPIPGLLWPIWPGFSPATGTRWPGFSPTAGSICTCPWIAGRIACFCGLMDAACQARCVRIIAASFRSGWPGHGDGVCLPGLPDPPPGPHRAPDAGPAGLLRGRRAQTAWPITPGLGAAPKEGMPFVTPSPCEISPVKKFLILSAILVFVGLICGLAGGVNPVLLGLQRSAELSQDHRLPPAPGSPPSTPATTRCSATSIPKSASW